MKNHKIIDSSWDFEGVDTKYLTHGFHSYPAMMIPQIAERLIKENIGKGKVILDPFCGSGTVLVEAMIKNKKAYGIDINPLTELIAKVKTTPINPKLLNNEISILLKNIEKDFDNVQKWGKKIKTPEFFNIDYWFKPLVIKKLTVIKNNIDKLKGNKRKKDIYDFFLVVFSETVRQVSNKRSGEFKLYRITKEKLKTYNPDVFGIFEKNLINSYKEMEIFYKKYDNNKRPKILTTDTREEIPISEKVDLVVTSPPYGDSRTTVAYGQFSRLSLQWLDMYDEELIKSIDKISLGGVPVDEIKFDTNSKILNKILIKLKKKSSKRTKDVLSFYLDLEKCLQNLSKIVNKNGYMCFVVGNRTVKGIRMPTDDILIELAENVGFAHIKTIVRNIPSKRMPLKTSPTNIKGKVGETISKESIVVLKKS